MGGVDQLVQLLSPAAEQTGSRSLAQNAVAALAVVCSDCPQALGRLEHIGGLSTLVAAARRVPDDINFNRGIALLLVQLCNRTENCGHFVSMGGMGLAAKAIARFAEVSDAVTDNYLRLLASVAERASQDDAEQKDSIVVGLQGTTGASVLQRRPCPPMAEHAHIVEALVHVLTKTGNFHILTSALELLSFLAVDEYGGDYDYHLELRDAVTKRIIAVGGKQALARAETHIGTHKLSERSLCLCEWFKNHVQGAPSCGRGALLALYRPSCSGRKHGRGDVTLTALDLEVQAHYMRALSSLGLDLDGQSSFDLKLSSRAALHKIREYLNSDDTQADDLLTIIYSGDGDAETGDWNQFDDPGGFVSFQELLQIWAGSSAQLSGAVLFIVSDSTNSAQLVDQARRFRPKNVVVQGAQLGPGQLRAHSVSQSATGRPSTAAMLHRSAFLLQWLGGIAARKVPSKILLDMDQKAIQPACYWPDNFPSDRRLLTVQNVNLEIPVLDAV
eukprot:INCI12949.1.p1 GENE.INCI12949.1~~INCI12949.1.p1  ORF type:complete len:589 (-),score=100.07 INCI12949.1:123-1628(-)